LQIWLALSLAHPVQQENIRLLRGNPLALSVIWASTLQQPVLLLVPIALLGLFQTHWEQVLAQPVLRGNIRVYLDNRLVLTALPTLTKT